VYDVSIVQLNLFCSSQLQILYGCSSSISYYYLLLFSLSLSDFGIKITLVHKMGLVAFLVFLFYGIS
jgi:hypothetical protein